jgi:hypothetical protein
MKDCEQSQKQADSDRIVESLALFRLRAGARNSGGVHRQAFVSAVNWHEVAVLRKLQAPLPQAA